MRLSKSFRNVLSAISRHTVKTSPESRRSGRRLRLEGLEARQMMAASVGLAAGELTITADPGGGQVLVQDMNPYNTQGYSPTLMIQGFSPAGTLNFATSVPKLGLHTVKFVGSEQRDTLGMNTFFRFDGPYYGQPNYYPIPIACRIDGRGGSDILTTSIGYDTIDGGTGDDTINAGGGNDVVYGNLGADTVDGSDGNDNLRGDGSSLPLSGHKPTWGGNDFVTGGKGNDTLSGYGGNDTLDGGLNDDFLYGSYGDDVLHGREGQDTLYGSYNNDNLYGGDGPDFLYGESGNDGLYGGFGINTLTGGTEADRFLMHVGTAIDFPQDVVPEDAKVYFRDPNSDLDVLLGSNFGWVRAYADRWTTAEVEMVDRAFDAYVDLSRTTTMLEAASAASDASMYFDRYGDVKSITKNPNGTVTVGAIITNVGGWNNGERTIVMPDNTVLAGETQVMRVVFHELAHNVDEPTENIYGNRFRAVAGWEDFTGRTVPAGHERAVDNNFANWYFDDKDSGLDGFARSYGKMNPLEDFATATEAYMFVRLGLNYYGETPAQVRTRLAARFDVLDDFFGVF